jgi:hypothetical protein
MGLNSIGKVQDTALIELRDPTTGKPIPGPNDKPQSVTLYGPYSAVYKKALREQQQQQMQAGLETTFEDAEARQVNMLIACVKEWNIALETDPLPCDPDTVRSVLSEHPWARDQLLIAHGSVSRFLAKSKSN